MLPPAPHGRPQVPQSLHERPLLVRRDSGEPHPLGSRMDAPVGATPASVQAWFDATLSGRALTALGSIEAAREAARDYAIQAKSENTRRAYRAAVRVWCAWCATHNLSPLPAFGPDVAAFLAEGRDGGASPTTLDLRRAAIRHLHRVAGCAVPTDDACVAEALAGIRRHAANRGERPRKKKAATPVVLARLLASIPDDLRGLRDRALLLIGFAGALRRSELAAITLADIEQTTRGLRLTLSQTKGSQDAAVIVPLPYGETAFCPVRALDRWLAAAAIVEGPVFRRIWVPPQRGHIPASPRIGDAALTAQSVALIVQARAQAAGFGRRDLGGHSLKRGALTAGMEKQAHPTRLKRLGRHKSYGPLGEYLEFGDLFAEHPLDGIL